MTLYQIEVRAVADRHDVHAHQLVHEILQLPTKHLPSLAELSADTPQPTLRTAQLYRIQGDLSTAQIDQLIQQLLVDPVVQEATYTAEGQTTRNTETGHIVDVFFHAGVTDTLAESVMAGAQMVGITEIEAVETGRRYVLDGRLSEADAHSIAQSLLFNAVIQHYTLDPFQGSATAQPTHDLPPVTAAQADGQTTDISSTDHAQHAVRTIFLSGMNDEQLMEVSRAGLLSLNLEEMRTIQRHYRDQGREPTDVELETLAQTWSEHCSHKTFKATIQYREVDAQGHTIESETIEGLLKRYIVSATDEVKQDWLVSAFSDNAGIIRLTDTQDVAFKVETHNHPSAIEPFGGANTGVGGVIRDVVGVSAQPIACTDILCFGPLDTPADELPAGVLTPRRIASGVVNGVRDYGNKMGIPTVNGAILYHPGYTYNPLVFCGCLGILPHGSHPTTVEPGDLIVSLGGRTGRDGVHGATFSSGEMSLEINTQAGTAVQIGAPITEKKVTDVIIQARDRRLYHAITDCGAGGFSSAIGEMGSKTGARVELSKAPLKYQGLAPWEIWLSEAQERMVLAVPPAHLDQLLEICAIEEVEASILGTFTSDHRLTLTYNGQVVADMDMEFLHDGLPRKTLDAVWKQPEKRAADKTGIDSESHVPQGVTGSLAPTLLALLRHPSIASKEEVVRRYDHEVQGGTVRKPLVGRAGNGPGDAAVLQPLIEEDPDSKAGVVLSNGVNPLYGKIDPYHMAVNAVDEALRNLTAVGGDVTHAAILDNFCWGNPTDPEQLGLLVRAVKGCHDAAVGFGTPFISGKDSLNNEYRADGQRFPVIPTLVISAVSVIKDVTPTVDMALKTPGNLLYQVGGTRNEMAGSHYGELIDTDSFARLFPVTRVPHVRIAHARQTMATLGEAIRRGLVRSCHDLSEGGLAVAAAEMSLAGMRGATLHINRFGLQSADGLSSSAVAIAKLFSESATRFLVEVTPEQLGAFENYMHANGVEELYRIGSVTNTSRFIVQNGEEELLNVGIDELQTSWKGGRA
ncbi:phosphoribosylformylglycinamidine synthase subunit PurL [Dictyobacter aurantiacus]|uniref:Phosphoribosylformylglycinamidine synthase subunit PurL n=1 Tax=Dictyobacter aurantiacus TaxID=1936993 RepID=A0A401ZDQ9_9CHLR|nr:phosphoribosylformylglycinamidine synthase subunit PurL [Dictyobacter aurantiacus]GCE04973.1 phosphoribosylformylglycinamidine synthase subunit PurL [Dictyobacter aurantiacus]